MPKIYREYVKDDIDKLKLPLQDEIIRYIELNNSENFDEILVKDNRWEVFYHFSIMRTSVLNWYDFRKNASALEIGAELGALTGLLCDRCKAVTVVEESLVRAEAIAKRYSKRENLHIYAGNIKNILFRDKFDYIILIGGLETVCAGSNNLNLYAQYIKELSELLKSNGKLIFSVENRYGIKYFCGTPEKYTRRPFSGINNYPIRTNGYCFSKREIEDIIKSAGIRKRKFYYPVPDYLLTQEVYSEMSLPKNSIKDRVVDYYLQVDTLIAKENILRDEIIKNNLFEYFNNSYLIECSKGELLSDICYAAVSTDRGEEHGFATTVFGKGEVHKQALSKNGIPYLKMSYSNILEIHKRGIKIVPHKFIDNKLVMPYEESEKLVEYLAQIVKTNLSEYLAIFDRLYRIILESSEHVDANLNKLKINNENIGIILKKAYIDMIPLNCFYKSGELLFFDQEFAKENYPAKYVLFRAIRYTYLNHPEIEERIPQIDLQKRYGLEDLWSAFLIEEDSFIETNRNHKIQHQFYVWANRNRNYIKEKGNNESVQNENSKYEIIYGFDKLEKSGENSWHWALNQKSEILVLNEINKNRYCEIEFTIEPPPNIKSRIIEIYINNHLVYKEKAPFHYIIPLEIFAKEQMNIRFETEDECVSILGGDNRKFAFQLVNLQINISDELYLTAPVQRKLQDIQLDLLQRLNEVCIKHNIKVFAIYGTLLGTIRNQGMIPWDDDIDIALMRSDYEKLLTLAQKEFNGKYFLQIPENDKHSFYGGYAKLRNSETTMIEKRNWGNDSNNGVSIDIFPLDFISENHKLNTKQIDKINCIQLLLFAKIYKNRRTDFLNVSKIKWWIYKTCAKFLAHSLLCSKLKETLTMVKSNETMYIGVLARYQKKNNYRFYHKKDYKEATPKNFSDIILWVPQNYENYLQNSVGMDYMLYPSKDIRHPHHRAIWELELPTNKFQEKIFNNKMILRDKDIILWTNEEEIEYYFQNFVMKCKPRIIVTEEKIMWGTLFNGYLVTNPSEIINPSDSNQMVIICQSNYFKVVEYLQNIYVNNYLIVEPSKYFTIEER